MKNASEANDEGITALHNAVCAGHYDVVQFLVDYGCDVNAADNDGWYVYLCVFTVRVVAIDCIVFIRVFFSVSSITDEPLHAA